MNPLTLEIDVSALERAIYTHVARFAGTQHPVGYYDDAGRWWPSAEEWRPCCAKIRRPTGRYPYSLSQHCRTAEHVAHLHGLVPLEFKRALRDSTRVLLAVLNQARQLDESVLWHLLGDLDWSRVEARGRLERQDLLFLLRHPKPEARLAGIRAASVTLDPSTLAQEQNV